MSLKDHSDTWVNATTFIHTSNAHLQGPRGSHGTQSVTSLGTASGKACARRKGAPPTSQFVWAESAGNLICLGGTRPLTQEREILWQGEAHRGESPLMLVYIAREHHWKAHSAGSSAGALFPPGCSPLMSLSPLLIGDTFGCNLGVCDRLL
jgi:hypothetical protein